MKTNLINCSIALAVTILVGLGCSGMKDAQPAAERGVVEFHNRLNERRFDEIYDTSDDGMKKLATREELVKLLSLVRSKLGRVVDSKMHSFKVHYSFTTTVTMVQRTTFENGQGDEQFVFTIGGGKPLLYGYHINSLDLLEK